MTKLLFENLGATHYTTTEAAIVLKRIANNPFVNKINDIFLIFDNKVERLTLSNFK